MMAAEEPRDEEKETKDKHGDGAFLETQDLNGEKSDLVKLERCYSILQNEKSKDDAARCREARIRT